MREKKFFYRRSKLSGAGLPVRPYVDTSLENPGKWVPKVHGAQAPNLSGQRTEF